MRSDDFITALGSSNWKFVNGGYPKLYWEEGTAMSSPTPIGYSDLDSTGYTAYIYIPPSMGTVSYVQFPTWTSSNGQDDLIWYTAELIAEGVYKYRINISNHNNEHGYYITHFYASIDGNFIGLTGGFGLTVP